MIQLTEFENAAYAIFIMLLTRVIISFQLNFLIPISKVDENLARSQKRDAILTEKFWFRKDVNTCESPPEAIYCFDEHSEPDDECPYTEMTINEIINGKDNGFPGLVPIVQKYMVSMDIEVDVQRFIKEYLEFIQLRAKGELKTTARWIRDFIANHPNYKFDSVVDERINYDLLCNVDRISRGKEDCPDLLGNRKSRDKVYTPDVTTDTQES